MLEFKIDSEDPRLLRIALAYDFFFDNYGLFLDAAVTAEKNDKEIVDEIEKVLNLSFVIVDMFMLQAFTQEDNDDNV
jgi:hypothetical protein